MNCFNRKLLFLLIFIIFHHLSIIPYKEREAAQGDEEEQKDTNGSTSMSTGTMMAAAGAGLLVGGAAGAMYMRKKRGRVAPSKTGTGGPSEKRRAGDPGTGGRVYNTYKNSLNPLARRSKTTILTSAGSPIRSDVNAWRKTIAGKVAPGRVHPGTEMACSAQGGCKNASWVRGSNEIREVVIGPRNPHFTPN